MPVFDIETRGCLMMRGLWTRRVGVVGTGVAMLLGFAAVPAQAATITRSTTGAAGRAVYLGDSNWELFARDTLSDGHCARWQVRAPGGTSWSWQGDSVCTSTEKSATFGVSNYSYRICRTGIGNCSSAATLP
ncbi:hypothetical protein [Micromonospora sp. WMMD1274]|uniref:hypothetical protein n=1 Tax=Micromonospora sp. WMMD1274 TaxID=3404116 RepID=UPI003B95E9CA